MSDVPGNMHWLSQANSSNNLANLFRDELSGVPIVVQSINTNWSDQASLERMQAALIDSIEEKKTKLSKFLNVELISKLSTIDWNRLKNDDYLNYRAINSGPNLGYLIDAANHARAARWMRKFAVKAVLLDETIVYKLHRRVFACERHELLRAGIYRSKALSIIIKQGERGKSRFTWPEPAKIPALMEDFGAWLREAPPGPVSAFEAHLRLVAIRPFDDGNGRVARLLMNLLLIRGGYPPVPMLRENRKTYIDSLIHYALTSNPTPFRVHLYQRLEETLGEYLSILQ